MTSKPTVVEFKKGKPPLTDVVARLRLLADEIDAGEHGEVGTAYVLIPQDSDYPRVFGFGEVYDRQHPIVVFELAKALMVNNLTART